MAFGTDAKYLEFIRKYPDDNPVAVKLFNTFFDFDSLPPNVYNRFIELLHPATNHFFRKTSRSNYFNSLDVRGIEVEDLECPTYGDEGCRDTHLEWTGRLSLNLKSVPDEWIGFLVVTGIVRVNAFPDPRKLHFVKKHEQLSLTGIPHNFEWFIHPTLKRLQISCDNFNFDQFTNTPGWQKLKQCQNLEEFFLHVPEDAMTPAPELFLETLLQQKPKSLNYISLICGDAVFVHETRRPTKKDAATRVVLLTFSKITELFKHRFCGNRRF